MADIRFRNLKTNTVDLERASRLSHPNKVIECRVLPPENQENLTFSLPHRLLIIAIRRGILAAVNTVDELLNGDQYNIAVRTRQPRFGHSC